MNEEVQSEILKSGLKAAPPVTVSLWEAVAGHINEIVLVLTLIYTVLMIAHLVYKFAWEIIERRRKERTRAQRHQRRSTDRERLP